MGRPKTRSKPRGTAKSTKLIEAEDGRTIVSVQGHTGEDVPPAKAAEILAAHVAGTPATRIARAFNTSYHTIIALIRNRPEALEKARQTAANNWKTLAAVGTAELLDRVPDMKDHGLVIMSAVATEKAELLSGGPTHRVEHVVAPAAEAWESFVQGLKQRGDVVDVAWEPVEVAGDMPQKTASALPPVNSVPQPEIIDADVQRLTL
jgi:hypothetical protein